MLYLSSWCIALTDLEVDVTVAVMMFSNWKCSINLVLEESQKGINAICLLDWFSFTEQFQAGNSKIKLSEKHTHTHKKYSLLFLLFYLLISWVMTFRSDRFIVFLKAAYHAQSEFGLQHY